MKRRAHQSVHSAVRFRNGAAVAFGLCSVLALSACSSSDNGDEAKPTIPVTSASSTPAPSSADPETAAKDQLLAAYRSYWGEMTSAYAKASMTGTKLKTYAKGNALGLAQSDLKNLQTTGQIIEGKPVIDPKVSSIDLEKKVPLGKITDCVDVSGWKALDSKTRTEVQLPKRRTKYVSQVTAERWGNQWVILEVKPEDRAC
ncbi:hypothetical protein ACH4PR_41065 [Streptomyces mirabilis]|uniref:hypothetical protein n=1 Tax=Streptomyces mirabilis TaxID=68239 RepID=UPI00379D39A2